MGRGKRERKSKEKWRREEVEEELGEGRERGKDKEKWGSGEEERERV